MKKTFATALAILSLQFVLAQEGVQQPPQGQESSQQAITVLADVNLTDLFFVEKDNVFTGQFTLHNKMGLQNEVVYGIALYNEKKELASAELLGEIESIQENEKHKLSFRYEAPSFLLGKAQVVLSAYTKEGLLLGSQSLVTKDFNGEGRAMTCSIKDMTISCTFKKDMTVTVTKSKALFSDETNIVQTIKAVKGTSKTINISGAPGFYYVTVKDMNGDEQKIFAVRIPGSFASINNIAVTKEDGGRVQVTASFVASPYQGTSAKYVLKSNGTECGAGNLLVQGLSGSASVETSCSEGNVAVTLFDSNGVEIAKKEQAFSIVPFGESSVEGTVPTNSSSIGVTDRNKITGIIAVLVLVLVTLFLVYKRSMTKQVTSALFFVAVFIGGAQADALSWSVVTWGPEGCGACEIAHMCTGAMSSNKSSYAPGETMIITSTLNINHDIGAMPQDQAACSVGYHNNTGTPLYDAPARAVGNTTQPFYESSGVIVGSGQVSIPYTTSDDFSFVAPATGGSHYLAVRPCLDSFKSPIFSQWDNDCNYFAFDFTVSSTPTVNLLFSLFERMKNVVL